MSSQDPLIGQTIAGFRLERLIGSGGMGRVYLATQLSLKRHIALKILPDTLVSKNEEFIDRFLTEALTAAQIAHPNVVQVHDAGEHHGTYYIAMEFVEGRGLDEILKERRMFPVEMAIEIAVQAARGLGAAEKRKLVHRDIKPSNLLLDGEGAVKIADFGLAKNTLGATAHTRAGEILGTPAYMSPEQANGNAADNRSDLYSLGATLFALVTGQPPFSGETPVSILMQQIHKQPPNPRDRNPEVPESLARVILRTLAKDPSQRYQTADEFIMALEQVRQSMAGTSAAPVLLAAIMKGAEPLVVPQPEEEEEVSRSAPTVNLAAPAAVQTPTPVTLSVSERQRERLRKPRPTGASVRKSGNLKEGGVAELILQAAKENWKGMLCLRNEEKEIELRVDEGMVSLHALNGESAVKLGELLLRLERISKTQLDQALEKQVSDRRRIGDILVEMGAVTAADREKAVSAQTEEELFDLFAWHAGTYDYVGVFPVGSPASMVGYKAEELVEKSVERLKEWREVTKEIRDDREIFTLTPEGKAALDSLDSGTSREAALLLTGEHDIADLVSRLLVPRYKIYRILGMLLQRGLVRRPSVEELRKAGLFMRDQRRLKLAIKLLERAFDLAPRDPSVLEDLAGMYESTGDGKRAAAFLKIRAQMAFEAGETVAGYDLCRRITSLHPIDAFAFQKLFEQARAGGTEEDLREYGRTLVRIYHAEKQHAKAIGIAREVLDVVPGDMVLRQKMVNLCLETGDKAGAIFQFEAMEGLIQEDSRRTADERARELLLIYDKILRLAPERAEIRSKLDAIRRTAEPEETKIIRKRSRKRFLWIAAAAAAVVLLVPVAFVFYRWESGRLLSALEPSAAELIREGRLAEAADRYGDFASGHPWTAAAAAARVRQRELRERVAEGERRAKAEEDRALARVQEGRNLLEKGELEAACAIFAEVSARDVKDRASDEARFARLKAEAAIQERRQDATDDLRRRFKALLEPTDPGNLAKTPEAFEKALETVKATFDLLERIERLWPGGAPPLIAEDRRKAVDRRLELSRRLQKMYADQGLREWERREAFLPDARALLQKALAIRAGDPVVVKITEEALRKIEGYAAGAEALAKGVAAGLEAAPKQPPAERQKTLEKAVRDVRDLAANFPKSEQARQVFLPLFVETRPPGARVSVDPGKALGDSSPVVCLIPLKGRAAVRVEKRGYETVEFAAEPGVVARDFTLVKQAIWSLRMDGDVEGGLTAGAGLVFAGGRDGSARAFRAAAEAAEPAWGPYQVKDLGGIKTRLAVSGKAVFLCTASTGELHALDALDGSVLWRRPYGTGRMVDHEPLVSDDGKTLYLGDIGGTVHAVRADNGEALWTVPVEGEKNRIVSLPAMVPDPAAGLFVPLASGEVVKLRAEDGAVLWRLAPVSSALSSLPTRVAVYGGLLLVTQADVFAAAKADSEKAPRLLWWVKSPRGGFSRPSFFERTAALVELGGDVLIVDLDRGETVRRLSPVPGILEGHPPLRVREKTWLVSSPTGRMMLLEEAEAAPRVVWTFDAPAKVSGPPILEGDLVLFAASNRNVYAIGID